MAENVAIAQPKAERESPTRPYPPSWVDRFTGWVARLPFPSWFFYVGLLLLEFLYVNAIRWANGKAPVGTFGFAVSFFVVFNVAGLVAIHYIDGVADTALAAFRPALTITEAEYERLRYELTNMPARSAWVAVAVGILTGIPSLLLLPVEITEQLTNSLASFVAQLGVIHVVNGVLIVVALYHTTRQLRLVSRIHTLAADINLFQPEPLYALSTLTSQTAAIYLLTMAYVVVVQPQVAFHGTWRLLFFGVALPVGIACFVLPLLGIHRRIVAEKQRLESEINRRLEAAMTELQRRMDAGNLADMNQLQAGIASLVLSLDVVSKKPTWPWQPGTFRGFLSALFLPIVVWLLQVLVQRFTGL